MSNREITGKRPSAFSEFHRNLPNHWCMSDIDHMVYSHNGNQIIIHASFDEKILNLNSSNSFRYKVNILLENESSIKLQQTLPWPSFLMLIPANKVYTMMFIYPLNDQAINRLTYIKNHIKKDEHLVFEDDGCYISEKTLYNGENSIAWYNFESLLRQYSFQHIEDNT